MGVDADRLALDQTPSGRDQIRQQLTQTTMMGGRALGLLALGLGTGLVLLTRHLAGEYLTWPPERRRPLLEKPEDYGLTSEDVQVLTEDGLVLRGWYMAGHNGATVIVQHGLPGGRQDGLAEAALFNRNGYNVLLGSFRAHDDCDGVEISYGHHEMKDFKAWHHHLLSRAEVDPLRVGIFGKSVGGAVAIRYAARNPDIAVVASASAPAVLADALAHIIAWEVPIPGWSVTVLARLARFWAERRFGCPTSEIDCLPYAGQISPRPLLVIQGGNDNNVPAEHGRLLYDAAGEPKELWFVEEAGHVDFEQFRPAEYERRLLAFFNRYLQGHGDAG